jgi:hypothetical protein
MLNYWSRLAFLRVLKLRRTICLSDKSSDRDVAIADATAPWVALAREAHSVQPSQPVAANTKSFTTHLLPNSPSAAQPRRGAPSAPVGGAWDGPGTAPRVATTPTVADLAVLYGGRGRLLRVAEVAEQLGVCNATVYRLCESGVGSLPRKPMPARSRTTPRAPSQPTR